MIDFTNVPVNRFKVYGGANGAKRGILYQNETHMLKFPTEAKLNANLSYANSTISEYIGCHVFALLGIPAQETSLGIYNIEGQSKIVCACKDMEVNQYLLKDFASLKNTVIESGHNGYGTELFEILQTVEEQNFVSPVALKRFFWDMFVVDAFVGNFDRHNGNWGFLVSELKQDIQIAPIFDCGSCLYPQMDANMKQLVMTNAEELNHRLYLFPTSALQYHGKKVNYFDFLSSNVDVDCTNSLHEITARIDLQQINRMIDEVDIISEDDKTFYKFMLAKRKEFILEQAIEKIATRNPRPSIRDRVKVIQSQMPNAQKQGHVKNRDSER